MLIHGVQMAAIWDSPEKTLKKAESFVKRASDEGSALVCFPEQFATGWDPASHHHLQGRDGPIVKQVKKLSLDYGIAILGSFREVHDPLPRNTCIVVDSEGRETASYSKCHLFSPGSEDKYYDPGDAPAIFEIAGISLGIAICYDLRFGSLFDYYSSSGVDGVLVPAAWPESRIDHWNLFIQARAVEGQMYVTGINTTGKTPVDNYCGRSMTAGPAGEIVSRLDEAEGLMDVEYDQRVLDDVRRRLPLSRDRRPDLYRRLNRETSHPGFTREK